MWVLGQTVLLVSFLLSLSTLRLAWAGNALGVGERLGDNVTLNGFGTLGLSRSTQLEVSERQTHRIEESLDFDHLSRLGLQLNYRLNERLSFVSQALLQNSDDSGEPAYRLRANWAYWRYLPSPELTLRAGLAPRPLFEYSDHLNVGYTYHWAVPPTPVYLATFRPFVDSVYALDAIHSITLNGGSTLKAQAYAGLSPEREIYLFDVSVDYEEHWLAGANLSLISKWGTFRAAYHTAEYSMLSDRYTQLANGIRAAGRPDLAQRFLINEHTVRFYGLGYFRHWDNWHSAFEMTRTEPGPNIHPNLHSWYASLSYTKKRWTWSYTLGQIDWRYQPNLATELQQASAQAAAQGSPQSALAAQALGGIGGALNAQQPPSTLNHTLGVGYSLNHNTTVKFEYEYLDGYDRDQHAHHYRFALDFLF